MSYFQNVFTADFYGNLVLGDRQHSPTFKCRGNTGRGDGFVVAWKEPTYNLTGTDGSSVAHTYLTLRFAIDPNFKNWSDIVVNVTTTAAANSRTSAALASDIVTDLNADATFNGKFVASVKSSPFADGKPRLQIAQKMPVERCRFYIKNGAAEDVLGFNARAGVDQLPDFFSRHTMANVWTYSDCQNMLIKLAPSGSNVDAGLINNAKDANGISLGYSSASTLADWELLRGRAGLFLFTKNTLDGNTPPRITTTLQYPAGAVAGDFAKKITYTYSSTNVTPNQITEYPYVLQSGDLVTPT
jgi:hypothetical protein